MIIRARHDKNDPYFRFRRATAQDCRLSWAARGVLAYLFSKPDNWEINPQAMMKEGNLGRDALYRILSELKEFGYVHRYQERRADGTLGRWVTDVHETPLLDRIETPLPDFQDAVSPLPGLPDPVGPEAAQPDPVNQEHTYKRKVQKREITKEEKQQPAAASALPVSPAGSRFALAQIEAFIRATKPHKTEAQIGGLARHLLKSGEEDSLIAEWIEKQARTRALSQHSPECPYCQGTGWQVIPGKGARTCPNLSH